jgi:hypothetical protein
MTAIINVSVCQIFFLSHHPLNTLKINHLYHFWLLAGMQIEFILIHNTKNFML